MQRLRAARSLARMLLAWFVLVVGIASLAPALHAASADSICEPPSAIAGTPDTGDRVDAGAAHTLQCPLCLPMGAPPGTPTVRAQPVQPLGHALRPVPAAHIASLTAAPLPARGPPASC
jgi:hypothetical protein